MNKIYDIAIIGAGPVGLFCGFQAGVNNMNAVLIDTLDVVGGQCSMLYPEKFIYDVPGHEKITAQNLINNLKKQCDRFDHDYLLGNQVIELKKEDDCFILKTNKDKIIYSKTVVICAGGGSFNPNKPAVENIDKFEDRSVFYLINDLKKFHNKNVMIAGGGDSAVDWSLMLMNHEFAPKKVYFVHRRSEMRCHPSSLEELKNLESDRFEFKIPYVLENLIGCHEKGELQSVSLKHFEDENDRQHIEVDYLLPFFGLKGDINAIKGFGLEFNKTKILVDYATMKSSIDGVYAIGDICEYHGKTKLLVSGFHEASVACNSIDEYLSRNFDRQKRAFEYSTSKFN